jgi:serine/threonine-protein kinase HipA
MQRFDRDAHRRIPFLSAMSMLGARDRELRSYLEIADSLRQYGSRPDADSRELWRRIVFNVLVSNTDDHLRNHGFLYEGGAGWRLAPAYDLTPVPAELKPRILSTAITFDSAEASLELALSVAEEFGLESAEAKQIAREVAQASAKWRRTAKQLGIAESATAKMESAFEHADLELAQSL